ncbi:DUF397 domain-containing protein [Streptomyces globisporus]|uniref:DUF397 domain-containing protein n=1 Tax=Streptomyces globisporus TaxID=1908 RepID=UPI0004CC5D41|nr:DUF397 domain-containing protein [Streptomyces globisporus]
MTTDSPRWFKSSYSNNGGNCVEVAHNLVPTLGAVPVRDSKAPAGPTFAVSAAAFRAFIDSVKDQQPGG